MGIVDPAPLPVDPVPDPAPAPTDDAKPLDDAQKTEAALLLDVPVALLDSELSAVVVGAGPADGIAAYVTPEPGKRGAIGQLGAIVLPVTATLSDMYRLIIGVAKAYLAAGYTLGAADGLTDPALVRQLESVLAVRAEEAGWEPRTENEVKAGKPAVPTVWRFELDLGYIVAQFEKALTP